MMERRLSRHPIEMSLMAGMAASGFAQLTDGISVGSVGALLPPWVQVALTIGMLGGAVVSLIGICWPDIPMGYYLEITGLVSIGFSFAAFAVTIVANVPQWYSTSSAGFTFGLTAGVWLRAVQIARHLLKAETQAQWLRDQT